MQRPSTLLGAWVLLFLMTACLQSIFLLYLSHANEHGSQPPRAAVRALLSKQQKESTEVTSPLRTAVAAGSESITAAGAGAQVADLRLALTHWLAFAEADAAAHGSRPTSSCNAEHGLEFLHSWQQNHDELCDPDTTAAAAAGGAAQTSSVHCWGYPAGQLGVTCQAHNMVVDTADFMGPAPPLGSQDNTRYLPAGRPGSVQLGCRAHNSSTAGSNHPQGTPLGSLGSTAVQQEVLPWLRAALMEQQQPAIAGVCSNAASSVQHPVMFVSRLDTTNPYHHTQTIVEAFLSLATVNSSSSSRPDAQGLQVILADHFAVGPFLPIWQRLSDPHPVLLLSNAPLAGQRVCFRDSILAHYIEPAKTFLGHEGIARPNSCPSTLLMAAAHWMRYLFVEQLPAAERQEYQALARAVAGGGSAGIVGGGSGIVGSNALSGSSGSGSGSGGSSSSSSSAAGSVDSQSVAVETSRHLLSLNTPALPSRALLLQPASSTTSRASLQEPASTGARALLQEPASSTSARTLLQEPASTNAAAAAALATPPPAAQAAALTTLPQHRRLNVVWLSRAWFSRSLRAGGGLTGWQSARDMTEQQEAGVVRAIEQAVLEWNSRVCAPPVFGWWQQPHAVGPQTDCKPSNVSFNFRFEELSVEDLYPDQLMLLTHTGVLVGIHGAALTNMVWMRPHSGAVVEVEAGGNFHYHNMAHQLGHKYLGLGSRGAAEIAGAVKQALDHVGSRY